MSQNLFFKRNKAHNGKRLFLAFHPNFLWPLRKNTTDLFCRNTNSTSQGSGALHHLLWQTQWFPLEGKWEKGSSGHWTMKETGEQSKVTTEGREEEQMARKETYGNWRRGSNWQEVGCVPNLWRLWRTQGIGMRCEPAAFYPNITPTREIKDILKDIQDAEQAGEKLWHVSSQQFCLFSMGKDVLNGCLNV